MTPQEILDIIKPLTVPMPGTLAESVEKALEKIVVGQWFIEKGSRRPYLIEEINELCGNLHAGIKYCNGERRIIRLDEHYRDEPI